MRILQVDGATVSEFMNFAALAYRSLIFILHSLHPSQEMVNGEGCEG